MKSFFALVTPFDPSLKPDQGLPTPTPPRPGSPPRPDHTLPGALPRPEHPIFYPLPPGAPPPRPDQGLPPYPDQGLPPTPPTGGAPPRPDQGLPPTPAHPIVLPPDSGNWDPVFIWGPGDARPTPPIAMPPDLPEEIGGGKVEWETIWTPANGWQVIGVIEPEKPVPTPSKKK